LTGTMQSEGLPAVGTDRCPPRQPAFCVARLLLVSLGPSH